MKFGRVEEFEKALKRLRGEKADISQEIADMKVMLLEGKKKKKNSWLIKFFNIYINNYFFGTYKY